MAIELKGVADEKPPGTVKVLQDRMDNDTNIQFQRNIGYCNRFVNKRWESSRIPFIAIIRNSHSLQPRDLD